MEMIFNYKNTSKTIIVLKSVEEYNKLFRLPKIPNKDILQMILSDLSVLVWRHFKILRNQNMDLLW